MTGKTTLYQPANTRAVGDSAQGGQSHERSGVTGWLGADYARAFRSMQAAGDYRGGSISGRAIKSWALKTNRARIDRLERAIEATEHPVAVAAAPLPTREQLMADEQLRIDATERARLAVVRCNQRAAARAGGYANTPEGDSARRARTLRHNNMLRRLEGEKPPQGERM